MCAEALFYYNSIRDTVKPDQLHNYNQVVRAIQEKLKNFKSELSEHEVKELLHMDRVYLFHQSLICSVELLQSTTMNYDLVTNLWYHLTAALELTGAPWDKSMYTDMVDFKNAFTKSEKVVNFIFNLTLSGLHNRINIIKLINQYIKIINILQLNEKINVDLPTRRDLHNLSFAQMPDFKY